MRANARPDFAYNKQKVMFVIWIKSICCLIKVKNTFSFEGLLLNTASHSSCLFMAL